MHHSPLEVGFYHTIPAFVWEFYNRIADTVWIPWLESNGDTRMTAPTPPMGPCKADGSRSAVGSIDPQRPLVRPTSSPYAKPESSLTALARHITESR